MRFCGTRKDGHLDPSGTTYAFAKSAKAYGAKYFTHCGATDMTQRPNGSWDIVTPKGTINAEHVVNCGGLWAREVGHMAGIHLPVQPMEHHYLITEPYGGGNKLWSTASSWHRFEANVYCRQERQGMLWEHTRPRQRHGKSIAPHGTLVTNSYHRILIAWRIVWRPHLNASQLWQMPASRT